MLLPCLACDATFRPDEYFSACSDYDRGLDLVSWTCPRCGNRDDMRVLPGELGFGYPSGGRFDVHDRVRVPGLRRRRRDMRLDITLDRSIWHVPIRRPACTAAPPATEPVRRT
ncbi:hypothetical protein ACFMQL_13390 [Nonomuraea fastidiosa]|jgi:hypothetical protein|uniref:hypothetical protein n=1 Tax=Nonomuraea TaxID=83681 RepID=UPI00324A6142